MSASVALVAVLMSWPNRSNDTARTASHMAQLSRFNPTVVGDRDVVRESALASGQRNHKSLADRQRVNWSVDTTTQGRVPRCSLATVGSSVTAQTLSVLGSHRLYSGHSLAAAASVAAPSMTRPQFGCRPQPMTLDYHSLCPPRPHMPALAPVTAMAEDAIVDRRGRAGRDARLLPDPAATRGDGAAHDPCPRSWTRSARSVTCGTGCRRTTAQRGPTCSPLRSTGPTWRRARCPGSATRRRSGCSPGNRFATKDITS